MIDNKFTSDELNKIAEKFGEHINKIPKNIIQSLNWCENYIDDQIETLAKSGLDVFQQIGVLEQIKQKIQLDFYEKSKMINNFKYQK